VGRIGLVVHFLETKDLHMIWPLLGVRGLGGWLRFVCDLPAVLYVKSFEAAIVISID
jgi:hypothetical protein